MSSLDGREDRKCRDCQLVPPDLFERLWEVLDAHSLAHLLTGFLDSKVSEKRRGKTVLSHLLG